MANGLTATEEDGTGVESENGQILSAAAAAAAASATLVLPSSPAETTRDLIS